MVTLLARRRDLPIDAPILPDPTQGILTLGSWWESVCNDVDALDQGFASSRDPALADQAFRSRIEQERVIGEAILSLPATTMAELAMKARILARVHGAQHRDPVSIAQALQAASEPEERAALVLAFDILRLAR